MKLKMIYQDVFGRAILIFAVNFICKKSVFVYILGDHSKYNNILLFSRTFNS
jgi:hypothetical protein